MKIFKQIYHVIAKVHPPISSLSSCLFYSRAAISCSLSFINLFALRVAYFTSFILPLPIIYIYIYRHRKRANQKNPQPKGTKVAKGKPGAVKGKRKGKAAAAAAAPEDDYECEYECGFDGQ